LLVGRCGEKALHEEEGFLWLGEVEVELSRKEKKFFLLGAIFDKWVVSLDEVESLIVSLIGSEDACLKSKKIKV